eukprot:TRINITY_DN16350_c0_g1_i1.p1 TRINITY_DN16350_c0_g1~~TRINITY_DN16350_c0_g1_i1.p1  ORF type:complete len:555 (+),score=122.81 TRINITY_DN16350_c0_g1_i1:249-1667(+)
MAASAVELELAELRSWLALNVVAAAGKDKQTVTRAGVAAAIQNWASARAEDGAHCSAPEARSPPPPEGAAPTGEEPVTILLLTHRAIRAGVLQSLELLGTEGGFDEGAELIEQTSRLIHYHTRQEDQVIFPVVRAVAARCPGLSRRVREALVHDGEEAKQANVWRTLVAQFRSRSVGAARAEALSRLRALAADSVSHMQAEEQILAEVLPGSDRSLLQQLTDRLLTFDTSELLRHVIPFTVRQLCRDMGYHEGIRPYVQALRTALFQAAPDVRDRFNRAILLNTWEARSQYAAELLKDGLLKAAEARAPLPRSDAPEAFPMTRSKRSIVQWLEAAKDDGAARASWDWRDVQADRTQSEYSALLSAEQLHEHLADDFAQPLNLKHVVVEESHQQKEVHIYFFIDSVWDVARRSLFAKTFTRRYKSRGQKMKVYVVDAKLRRTLLRDRDAVSSEISTSEGMPRLGDADMEDDED